MDSYILKGHICYSKNQTELSTHPDSYAICEDGICKGVFSQIPERYEQLPIHDYGDRLIMPGMVDLHIHAPQYAFRGLGMDLELLEWLNEQAFAEEAKYADLDYARIAYGIFAEEMKKSATSHACIYATCHGEATELLMEFMEQTGLVCFVGKVNMDRNVPAAVRECDAASAEARTRQWIDHVQKRFVRTKPIVTPRFVPACSDELLQALGAIAEQYHLPVQSHLSENRDEIEWVRQLCPDSQDYADVYDRHGLFGKPMPAVMAHCVYSSEKEIERMKQNEVWVAHCPASNLNLASGMAPIRRYLMRGLRVGLGSDVAGGHTESIFRAVTDAIQVSKMYWRMVDQAYAPITFEEAFYMATKGGGAFFGKVGSFEDGYEWNAIVADDSKLPHPQELTVRQRLERFLYLSGEGKGILAKYVSGVKVWEVSE